MSSCSSEISSKVCGDRGTGRRPPHPCRGGRARPGDSADRAHVLLLPPELAVHSLHLPQPLPEGEFCGHPLGFELIVGLEDGVGGPAEGVSRGHPRNGPRRGRGPTGDPGVTWAIVRAMASRSSTAAFISASARLLFNWLKPSHCWRVEELQGGGGTRSGPRRPAGHGHGPQASYPSGTRVGSTFRVMLGDVRLRDRQPRSMSRVSTLSRWSALSCWRASCRRLGTQGRHAAWGHHPRPGALDAAALAPLPQTHSRKGTQGRWQVGAGGGRWPRGARAVGPVPSVQAVTRAPGIESPAGSPREACFSLCLALCLAPCLMNN